MYRRAIAGNGDVQESIGKSLAAALPSCLQYASCPRGDLLSVGPVGISESEGWKDAADCGDLLRKRSS